ncbi:MAG: hypothetical protein HUU26_08260 [Gemmatimonadaceae bacterium]|nr:hypothetical protein [Gemmatimonadaceae bacterium]
MWALIQSLVTKWALFRVLLKTLGSLAWLIPVAFVLKFVGLPVLAVLAILALPVFIILALVGLPIMFAFVAGVLLLVGFFALLSFGIAILKIAIPIAIIYFLFKWWTNGKKGSDPATDA